MRKRHGVGVSQVSAVLTTETWGLTMNNHTMSIDWLHSQLNMKDFAIFAGQVKGYMTCIAVGELNGNEVVVELPYAFRNLPENDFVEVILDQAKAKGRLDLGHRLLELALGATIADKVMKDHGYLTTITL